MPAGAQGAAGFWLPIAALFTGARQAELAGLRVSNVQELEGVPLLFIVVNRRAGKRIKTKASERVVPVHPELVKLGFLNYVAERANCYSPVGVRTALERVAGIGPVRPYGDSGVVCRPFG